MPLVKTARRPSWLVYGSPPSSWDPLSSLPAGRYLRLMLGGYFGGAFQDMGISYMLTSISATVIGGTSAARPQASVAGSVCGALMLHHAGLLPECLRLPAATQEFRSKAYFWSQFWSYPFPKNK